MTGAGVFVVDVVGKFAGPAELATAAGTDHMGAAAVLLYQTIAVRTRLSGHFLH